MSATEESPVEGRDGCGGKDSHTPIIDHGDWRTCSDSLFSTAQDGCMLQKIQRQDIQSA